MDEEAAKAYIQPLIGRQFKIYTTDDRVFAGELKCTDNECNVILAKTLEYRASPSARDASVSEALGSGKTKATVQMSSRFLGLVVVPGAYITKIEVEERPIKDIPMASADAPLVVK